MQQLGADFFVFSGHKIYGPNGIGAVYGRKDLLDKEGIAVRAGHHCAQPALRALGYEMSVRPTFALYNTKEDVDKLVIAVRKIAGERNRV